MIVSIYLMPMKKAAGFKDFVSAANLVYDFNDFMIGFGSGIIDLPKPINPDMSDVMERRNPMAYYEQYYYKYAPLVSRNLGKYQRDILNYIKEERGN